MWRQPSSFFSSSFACSRVAACDWIQCGGGGFIAVKSTRCWIKKLHTISMGTIQKSKMGSMTPLRRARSSGSFVFSGPRSWCLGTPSSSALHTQKHLKEKSLFRWDKDERKITDACDTLANSRVHTSSPDIVDSRDSVHDWNRLVDQAKDEDELCSIWQELSRTRDHFARESVLARIALKFSGEFANTRKAIRVLEHSDLHTKYSWQAYCRKLGTLMYIFIESSSETELCDKLAKDFVHTYQSFCKEESQSPKKKDHRHHFQWCTDGLFARVSFQYLKGGCYDACWRFIRTLEAGDVVLNDTLVNAIKIRLYMETQDEASMLALYKMMEQKRQKNQATKPPNYLHLGTSEKEKIDQLSDAPSPVALRSLILYGIRHKCTHRIFNFITALDPTYDSASWGAQCSSKQQLKMQEHKQMEKVGKQEKQKDNDVVKSVLTNFEGIKKTMVAEKSDTHKSKKEQRTQQTQPKVFHKEDERMVVDDVLKTITSL